MSFVHDNWPYLMVAIAIALVIAFLLARPRQRVRLSESAPVRPHMASDRPRERHGLASEAAAATSDVAGEIFGAPARAEVGASRAPADDFVLLKGVGPRFAEVLNQLGFTRFEQLASLTPPEIERLDPQLGAFRGRIARDHIVEQADYLARGDTDGFEQRFGKL